MENVSIVIVTKNRAALLNQLLENILRQIQNPEIIILLNDSKKIGQEYTQLKSKFPHLIWKHREFKTPGLARNEGVRNSSHNWILFLDDDVDLPEDYFEKSQAEILNLSQKVLILGGPDQPFPNQNSFEAALSLTLSSPMATAHTRFRHLKNFQKITSGDETNLILCNLWVHRSVFFESSIWFRESFFRNEENVFITEAQRKQIMAAYSPNLAVFHKRKTSLFSLGKALISSGKHRIKSFLIGFEFKHLIFTIPAGWVLYLFLLPITLQLSYSTIPLKLYSALTLFISLKLTSRKPQLLALVIGYQIFINFFYGIGILLGLICLPLWFLRKNQL